MMNKPAGYVCSAVSDSHHTVYELLPPDLQELVTKPKRGHRLHTVGRLDCDTSGLLLLTNDGFFSHSLTAPEEKIEKTYIALLEKPEEKSGPAILRPLNKEMTLWEVKITEGKFHQVRRIFQALNNKVLELRRTAIGKWKLDDSLKEASYIFINKI